MIRLKELRKELKYTQKDVADFLNISQPAYGNYESGNRQPDYDTLKKLADFFNVTVDYILGRTENESKLDELLSKEEFALYGEIHALTNEEKKRVLDFIKFTKSQREE